MLELKLNLDNLTDVGDTSATFKDFLKEHKQEIYKHMSDTYDINPFTFEDGVDNWFGLGSVLLFELGMRPTIQYSAEEVILTLN